MDYIFLPQAAVDISTGALVSEGGLSGSVYASEADAVAETNPLTVTPAGGGGPTTSIAVSSYGQTPEFTATDHYQVWWRSGIYIVHLVSFDGLVADVDASREAAETAAQSAADLNVGVVRTINGQAPDENGAIQITGGGGGSGVVVLNDVAPVPEGTPSGTLIARSSSVPPPGQMDVVEETLTQFSSASGSDVSLALPSGTSAGDLLIAIITHAVAGSTWTPPAGWVLLQNLNNNDSNFRATSIYGLDVSAQNPVGTQVFTNNTSGRLAGVMFRVTGTDTANPLLAPGAVGTRPDNTYTVPLLSDSAGGLVLSVTNGQKASGDPAPQPLSYSTALVPFVSIITAPSGTGAQTFLDIAWTNTDVDYPEHTVTTAGASITAMGSQVAALRGAAA